jgi:phospholipid/cholesterol/gamma-HCH transport system permease protein
MSIIHKHQNEGESLLSIRTAEEETLIVALTGRLSLETIAPILPEIKNLLEAKQPSRLTLNLGGLTFMDSAGALTLLRIEDEAREKSIPFSIIDMSEEAKDLMQLIDRQALTLAPLNPSERRVGLIAEIGEQSIRLLEDIQKVLTFSGILIAEIISSLRHPRTVRWGDTINYMKKVGVDGLPILGLISFLLGLIMAFMSSLQLKQFGANIYVASLVGLAMVRELGPIITAVLVAGRSGSAFAAEIGTMKVNEEVDALITMGFDPVKFLAIPKVFAAMFVVPLLTLFSDLFAIFGGLLVGVMGLDITVFTYLKQTASSFRAFDVLTGVIKSMVFAVEIAGIGCHRGFEVRGGTEAVGNAATSAVVSSLFLIIVTDSTFAIILNYIR